MSRGQEFGPVLVRIPTFDRGGLATSFISPSPEWMNRWGGTKPPSRSPFSPKEEEGKTTQPQLTQPHSLLGSNPITSVNTGALARNDVIKPTETSSSPCPAPKPIGTNASSPEHHVRLTRTMANSSVNSFDSTSEVNPTSQTNMSSVATRITSDPSTKATEGFTVDVYGSANQVQTGLPMPVVRRSHSPAGSASSEEIILFSGRGSSHTGGEKSNLWLWPSNNPVSISDPVGNDEYLPDKPRIHPSTIRSPLTSRAVDPNYSGNEGLSRDHNSKMVAKPKRRPRKPERRRNQKKIEQETILADYIANVDADDVLNVLADDSMHWGRQLDTVDTDGWQDEVEESEVSPRAESNTSYSVTWQSADLEALDHLSTSGEMFAEVQQVISKRDRPSGVQYLVVPEGYTVDDARWYPVALLSGLTAQRKIGDYETEQARLESYSTSSGSDVYVSRKEQLEQDLQDDLDDLADEQDLLDRRRDRLTDEQIARLFSKQEELGLGSHDLILYDGDGQHSGSGHATRSSHRLQASDGVGPSKRKGKDRYRNKFPSASLMADVLEQDPYNGFDIMDQDRPSLRRKVKGRRGKLPLELSDSELEQTLQSQWQKDRNKKKARKEEREKLRAEGFLGKGGKLNPKGKHFNSSLMAEFKEAIVDFLGSTEENLVLPAMSDFHRKIIHDVADTFNLKSKSFGKRGDRFPVLYRTSRTLGFNEDLLSRGQLRLFVGKDLPPKPKPFKGRATNKAVTRGGPRGAARGGGFSKAGTSYLDGDIVGAAAPELGQENRGRAMLEKMGWSTGTALGAMNNKGIMQPVTHVVKNSKAGLG